MEISSCTIS